MKYLWDGQNDSIRPRDLTLINLYQYAATIYVAIDEDPTFESLSLIYLVIVLSTQHYNYDSSLSHQLFSSLILKGTKLVKNLFVLV